MQQIVQRILVFYYRPKDRFDKKDIIRVLT